MEISAALAQWNINLPTGGLQGEKQAFPIQATGQLYNVEAFKPMVVTYRQGSLGRLKDIGEVTDGVENDKIAAWYNSGRGNPRGLLFWLFSGSRALTL